MIIENFVNHWTTDPDSRDRFMDTAHAYVEQDHVDEITQAGWIDPKVTPNDIQGKILYIRNVIKKWGSTSVAELELDSSPVFSIIGKQNQLLERFFFDGATVVTYIDSMEISEDDIAYEELNDELINEIYEIIKGYKTLCLEK